ncbi:MAG: hypothetical protein ICV77_17400 [Cyanobacteria bacterium Co-bin8]|nr:hypothetical protein [Cyanobacteria bacterium Co-bin8]
MTNFNSIWKGLVTAGLTAALAGSAGLHPARAAVTPNPLPNQTAAAEPLLLSQTNTEISENVQLIGQCRQANRAVEVFSTSALGPDTSRVGTLTDNSEVFLTGVIAPGRAQVHRPDLDLVGWVNAAFLAGCATATPTPPVTTQRACYRMEVALSVRTEPAVNAPLVGTTSVGQVLFATTSPPNIVATAAGAPNFAREWVQVTFEGTPRWIARTGPNQIGSNVTQLPAAQCAQ